MRKTYQPDKITPVLYVKEKHLEALGRIARNLPPRTIQPLDASIPDAWKYD